MNAPNVISISTPASVFGTVSVAMVTPFTAEGGVDFDAAARLSSYLVEQGCDALVLSGTTGESPTTTPAEKRALIQAVREAVGPNIKLTAGVGTYNTAESVELAKQATEAGADGLLVVTPYYSRPSQEGIYRHFTTVADATDTPICLYDIPSRSVVGINSDTIKRLAEHKNIQALKDAKGDLGAAASLIATTGLDWYSGDDSLNLPWLSIGATGFISVIGHVAAAQLRQLLESFEEGDLARAREINATLTPLTNAQARLGGVSFAKAALNLMGMHVGEPRLPQIHAGEADLGPLTEDLTQAGVL